MQELIEVLEKACAIVDTRLSRGAYTTMGEHDALEELRGLIQEALTVLLSRLNAL